LRVLKVDEIADVLIHGRTVTGGSEEFAGGFW
jgi:hypothetical protein